MKTYDNGAGSHSTAFRWMDVRARLRRWFDREREIVTLRNAVGMMAEARRVDANEYHEMGEALRNARYKIGVLEAHLARATKPDLAEVGEVGIGLPQNALAHQAGAPAGEEAKSGCTGSGAATGSAAG